MLSENIKAARCQKGISQEELAKKLNIVRQTVSKWESGASVPDSQILVSLADELEVTVGFLLGVEEADEEVAHNESQKAKRKFKAWEIVLLLLGSPIWLSLGIAAFAVIISLYLVLWVAIIAFWVAFGSLIGGGLGGIAGGLISVFSGDGFATGIAMIGVGIICAGLSIFLFFGCKAATKGAVWITHKLGAIVKNSFTKKGEAQ